MRNSIRKFKCKRCGKNATDKLAVASGVFEDGVKWEHENIDLCDHCFKITRKEASQTDQIRDMLALNLITDDQLSRFQTDKKFKKEMFEKYQKIKREQLKIRNEKIKGVGVSPSDQKRKDSRKLLQQVRSLEK